MKENQFFQQGSRGCLVSLAGILLAIFALVVSVNYHYPEHPVCRGMLGGGFPALFICDDWGGGSPTGSWGKIDFVDVINGGIRPAGLLLDFLFYILLIWIALFVLANILHKGVNQPDFWWGTFILIGFTFGFLGAFLVFQSSDFKMSDYYARTPTPFIPTATSVGTMPSMTTPNATPPP